jgi:hypothetical protein
MIQRLIETLRHATQQLLSGIADSRPAKTRGAGAIDVRNRRKELGVKAEFSRVDTCAAECGARYAEVGATHCRKRLLSPLNS